MSDSQVIGVGTGPITLAPVGSAPNANAATLVGSALNLQPASSVFPGVVNIVSQTFKGIKSFTDTASFNNGLYTTHFQLNAGSYIGPTVDGSFGYDGAAKRLIGTNGATWDTYVTRSDLSTTSIGINTGDVTLAAIGGAPNANAATLTGQVLNLQPASASFGGIVTTGAQAFAGAKTFNNGLTVVGGVALSGGNTAYSGGYGIICQDTSGNLVIQITPSANGAIEIGNSLGAGTTPFIDFHYGVGVTQDYNVRLINNADGVLTCGGTFNATNISGINTGNVTLSAVGSAPNANAATLTGQAFNLQPADGSNPGVITAGAQTIGGAKTFSAAATFTLGATFNGNATFGAAAVVDFLNTTRALISLYGNHIYSIGVQPNVFFQRSGAGFAWYSGGVYSGTANDPGAGGTRLMDVSSAGNLTLLGSVTSTSHVRAKANRSAISTPSAANITAFIDLDGQMKTKDSSNYVDSHTSNASLFNQNTIVAGTRTYIAGSQIALASAGALQVGSMFVWRLGVAKGSAGGAVSNFDIAIGTAGTVADAARITITKPASTAVGDAGWIEINAIVRAIGASGNISATFYMTHNLATTGLMTQQSYTTSVDSGFFDTSTLTFVGLCVTVGAGELFIVNTCQTEAWNI